MATKDKVKIHFDLQVKKINRLPERLNGSTLFLLWRRGSKKHSGQTKRALVKDGEATWEESISFVCSLFREPDSERFDAKTIAFALKEVKIPHLGSISRVTIFPVGSNGEAQGFENTVSRKD